jgi:hydrogenase expression/formation protein HypD
MKELRNPAALRSLLSDIGEKARRIGRTPRLMEVCGTHTMALFKSGLTPLLAEAGVEMVSGPGCPVCITPNAIHEAAIAIVTGTEGTTLATFGDMTRVPTRKGSLQTAIPARDSRMRIVYSPEEALVEARREPAKKVVFFGAGFETTIPAIAYTVRQAAAEGLRNFSVLPALWLVPPALRAILEAGEAAVDGFIYPGHVSAVIGAEPYEFVARDFGVPGAIAGFEPGDILLAIRSVLDQTVEKKPRVALEYSAGEAWALSRRAVSASGRSSRHSTPHPGSAWKNAWTTATSPAAVAARSSAASSVRRGAVYSGRSACPIPRSAPAWCLTRGPASSTSSTVRRG